MCVCVRSARSLPPLRIETDQRPGTYVAGVFAELDAIHVVRKCAKSGEGVRAFASSRSFVACSILTRQ